jgi:RNA polymerase-binding transcription factor DksA
MVSTAVRNSLGLIKVKLLEEIATLQAELQRPLTDIGLDPASRATDTERRAAIANENRKEIKRKEEAIRRIEEGTFGVCPCGGKIDVKDNPTRSLCKKCCAGSKSK